METIDVKELRKLFLEKPSPPGRPSFVSAASGLVQVDDFLYIIADDESGIAQFSVSHLEKPGQYIPIFQDDLPLDFKNRKKQKRDFEAICIIKDHFLLVSSGSKSSRMEGALLHINDHGLVSICKIDFSPLFKALKTKIEHINIEGIALNGPFFKIFQRGNVIPSVNMVIDLDYAKAVQSIFEQKKLSEESILSVTSLDLGTIKNTPFGFTDAAQYDEESFLFVAAAENTGNTYDDGVFQGACIGILSHDNKIQKMKKLNISEKPEGILWAPRLSPSHFLLVTDADDISKPAALYEGML